MGLPAAPGDKLELPPYVIHGGSAPNPILTGDGGGYFLSLPAPAAIAPRLLPSPFVPSGGRFAVDGTLRFFGGKG
jgi:hypothetical protein